MEMENNITASKMIEAALAYIKRGWAIFPLAPGSKIPLKGSKGFKDASKEHFKVRAWWKTNPAANVGIATGKISGLFVFDLDDGSAGIEAWAELCRQHSQPEIETLTARTLSDGRHLLFQYPPGDISLGCSAKTFPHIDTRGNGGYIVAPPSYAISKTHKSFYSWLNPGAPLAEMPTWLIAAYQGPAAPAPTQAAVPAQPNKIILPGARHDTIKRTIRGYAESSVYFIHLWKRAFALVYKVTVPAPGNPFTVLELFNLCWWAWNEARPEEQFSQMAAWKMLKGRARDTGDIAFGEAGDSIYTLFIPTSQQHNISNIPTSQSD